MRTSSCILATLAAHLALAKDWESPVYSYLYQFEMPISPIKQPLRQFNFPNAPPIDYFEVEIKPFEQQIYPNLGKTRLVGYDGTYSLVSRIDSYHGYLRVL
jgi:bilirubin oxidase